MAILHVYLTGAVMCKCLKKKKNANAEWPRLIRTYSLFSTNPLCWVTLRLPYTYPSFLTEIRHLLVLPPPLVLLLPFVHNTTVFTTYIRILIESGDIITSAMILLTQLLDVSYVSSG